jgi:hypothetical protein
LSDEESYGYHIDKPPNVSWLNSKAFLLPQILPGEVSLVGVLSKRNLEVVFSEKKSLSDVRFFGEKGHSPSVTPEPLAIWNKRLEGLESFELKKLKNLS